METPQNPKLEGSHIIDAVPQTGPCPNNCDECYYNRQFYAPLDQPIIPTLEEVGDKIVRVNSGHDSNLPSADWVMEATAAYKRKYYNTSMPQFDFDAPVVFTCNGMYTDSAFWAASIVINLMAVRIRVNSWNTTLVDDAVRYYTLRGVPVLLTFMRYYSKEAVVFPEDYEYRKHILHSYWDIKPEVWKRLTARYEQGSEFKSELIFTCGTPWQSLCKDCGNCRRLYDRACILLAPAYRRPAYRRKEGD